MDALDKTDGHINVEQMSFVVERVLKKATSSTPDTASFKSMGDKTPSKLALEIAQKADASDGKSDGLIDKVCLPTSSAVPTLSPVSDGRVGNAVDLLLACARASNERPPRGPACVILVLAPPARLRRIGTLPPTPHGPSPPICPPRLPCTHDRRPHSNMHLMTSSWKRWRQAIRRLPRTCAG